MQLTLRREAHIQTGNTEILLSSVSQTELIQQI